jgi:uncharacterized phage protein (TIGR02218 family)
MTYAALDTSRQSGAPVELYAFVQGLKKWNYASSDLDVEYLGQVFTASPIKRDRIKQTGDVAKDGITVTLPRDSALSEEFLLAMPEAITTLTLLRGHRTDTDLEFVTYWKGRVVGSTADGNTVQIDCESVFTSIRRPGLRAKFEYGCRHTLYASGCNVNRELFRHDGSILSISNGVAITVSGAASQPPGYYTGGVLKSPEGVTRFITAHTSDQITITRPIPGLLGGELVSIYPGCDHLRETCLGKFNNLDNFGGFPWIPGTNPFGGSSIV